MVLDEATSALDITREKNHEFSNWFNQILQLYSNA